MRLVNGKPNNWNSANPYVPVDKDGNWLHYAPYEHEVYLYVEPFYGEFKAEKIYTGRSAKYIVLRNQNNGTTATMFVSDLVDFLEYGNVEKGLMYGTWTVSKRGANYGIKAVKDGVR